MNDTYSMFRELRNVIKNELIGVPELVQFLLLMVGDDAADDLGLGVFELRVPSELLSLLLISKLVCHLSSKCERFLNFI